MLAADSDAGVAVIELGDERRSNTISHELGEDMTLAAASLRRRSGLRAFTLQGAGLHLSGRG